MKRFALILEASRATGQDAIDGCKRDAERWEAWLKSKFGGAWNDDEVQVVNNPYPFELRSAMPSVHAADFAIVAFSGHGRIVQDPFGRRKQMITIGDGTEIEFTSLTPRAPKKVTSCDACREIHFAPPPVTRTKSAATFNLESYSEQYSRAAYRMAYENLIESTDAGEYTMYSCSPNEYAGDDVLNGGYFTDSLLTAAARWSMGASSSSALWINDGFREASASVTAMARAKGLSQNPIASSSVRSAGGYPFAIALK